MDQEGMRVGIENSKNLCQVVEGVNGNPKTLVNGVVSETVIVKSSRENLCFSGENADSRLQTNGFGSCKRQEVGYGIGNGHPEVNGVVSETIILKNSKQNLDSILQDNGFGLCKNREFDYGRVIDQPLVNGVVSETLVVKISEGDAYFSGENPDLRLQNNVFGLCKRQEVDRGRGTGQPGVVSETVIVKNAEENVCFNGGNADLRLQNNGFRSCKHREVDHGRGTGQSLVNGIVSETVIMKTSEENADSRLQNNGFGSCKHQEVAYGRGIGHPLVDRVASETVTVNNSEETADSKVQNNGFGIGQPLGQNDLGSIGKSSSLVNGIVLDNEGWDAGENNNGVVSSEGLVEASKQLINKDTNEKSGAGETMDHVDQRSSESSCDTVDGFAGETVIVIKTLGAACVDGSNVVLEAKDSRFDSCKVLTERPKTKVVEADSCLIDIKGTSGVRSQFKEHFDGESLCRICHLSSEHVVHSSTTAATTELIQIGCGCKDELGIVHGHCAEAWFKLKGNRLCEICGQTAKNITGVGDNGFIESWYHQGSTTVGVSSSDQGRGRWRGRSYCNFFMGCLVIAFVLPWFFHVDMF